MNERHVKMKCAKSGFLPMLTLGGGQVETVCNEPLGLYSQCVGLNCFYSKNGFVCVELHWLYSDQDIITEEHLSNRCQRESS